MPGSQVVWSTVTKGLPFVVSSVTTIGLARVLPIPEYATYSLAMALLLIGASTLDAGVSTATARLLAERRYPDLYVATTSAILWLIAATVGALIAVVAIDSIALFVRSAELADLGPIIALLLAVRMGQVRLTRIAAGIERNETVGKASVWLSWVAPVLGVALPVFYEPTAAYALTGVAIGRTMVLLASVRAIIRAVGGSLMPSLPGVRRHSLRSLRRLAVTRRLIRYAAPQAGIGMSLTVYSNAGVILVQRLLGATDAAHYALAMRIIEMLAVPGAGFAAAKGPLFARLAEDAWRHARELARAILIFYVPVLLVLSLVLHWLIPVVVGPQFAPTAAIVVWFFPYLVCHVVATLFGSALDYLGTNMRRVAIVLGVTLLYIVVASLTFPHVGVRGAALITSAVYMPLVGLYAYLIASRTPVGVRPVIVRDRRSRRLAPKT